MKTNQSKIIILSISLCLLAVSVSVYAEEAGRKITVTGKSEMDLEAQYACIQLELKSVNSDMGKSYEQVRQSIELLSQRLKTAGIKNEELTKSLILQGAEYTWERDTRVLKGYYSACQLEIKVNQISNLNQVYKELANHKSITIHNTVYGRNDTFEIRNREFQKALLAAKSKAELMAAALNAKLGAVLSIEELSSENYVTAQIYSNVTDNAPGQNQEAAAFGKVTVRAAVTVEFELK